MRGKLKDEVGFDSEVGGETWARSEGRSEEENEEAKFERAGVTGTDAEAEKGAGE